jgi:hypothetical protein
VIVGATAMELRDSMAVPVHGIVTGSVLQMLAAETLLQHRIPFPLESWSLVPCLWRCCSCSPSCPSGYACHGF